MLGFKRCIILITGLLLLAGCADEPKPLGTNAMRQRVIRETAISYGAQNALAWESKRINQSLEAERAHLDSVFNFNALMLRHHVVPPVLTESHKSMRVDNSTTIRLADHIYKIVSPAKLTSTAPNWRIYLQLNFTVPERPDPSLLPENTEERYLWNHYLRTGWQQGIEQARSIFAVNVSRLKRDYRGMVLYRSLLAKHMLSAPMVAKADLGITGGGDKLRVNDQLLRITAPSQLDTDANTWQPAISHTTPVIRNAK